MVLSTVGQLTNYESSFLIETQWLFRDTAKDVFFAQNPPDMIHEEDCTFRVDCHDEFESVDLYRIEYKLLSK